MNIIPLTTCNNVIEANMIKHILENEGIDCFISNEISSTLLPHYNGMFGAGIKIMINEEDKEYALKLINNQ